MNTKEFQKYLDSDDEETRFRAYAFQTAVDNRKAEGTMVSRYFLDLAERFITQEITWDEFEHLLDTYIFERDKLWDDMLNRRDNYKRS